MAAVYRVNVRSNALLNNVRARRRVKNIHLALSRPSESRPCERMNSRAIEQALSIRGCATASRVQGSHRSIEERSIFPSILSIIAPQHRNRDPSREE